MHENLDASLSSLADEINELDRERGSTQVEMGRKLIAVRELLRARNGTGRGISGPDGPAPRGWLQWVADNLTICTTQCNRCIRLCFPDLRQRDYENDRRKSQRYGLTIPEGCINRTIKLWPKFTDADKDRLAAFIRDRILEEKAGAAR